MFPRDVVCLRNISVDTLHKGDTEDDDDDDDDDNNNNNTPNMSRLCKACKYGTDMRRLTTGIPSEKCVVRRFRRSANVIQCTYTNLDSTV